MTLPRCPQVTIVKEVPLYNSTMVLDDMAWGAVWLYKATGDPSYLGMAERYLTRHYRVRRHMSHMWQQAFRWLISQARGRAGKCGNRPAFAGCWI